MDTFEKVKKQKQQKIKKLNKTSKKISIYIVNCEQTCKKKHKNL